MSKDTTTKKRRTIRRRMTAADFETIRPLLRIAPERIEAARRALVDGDTFQKIADDYGSTRQNVYGMVNAVWTAYQGYLAAQQAAAASNNNLPAGWQRVTLTAPKYLIDEFRFRIQREIQKKGKADEKSN